MEFDRNSHKKPCHLSKGEIKQKIKYIDINSLYPSVNFFSEYPVGDPIIIKNNFDYSLKSYFGLIKCKISPRKNNYHPVLPFRDPSKENKLIFDNNIKTGTWTTEEVKLAISKGDKILKIYEVWTFNKKSKKLFKSYVAMYYKLKTEASGWPKGLTEQQKIDYVKFFKETLSNINFFTLSNSSF